MSRITLAARRHPQPHAQVPKSRQPFARLASKAQVAAWACLILGTQASAAWAAESPSAAAPAPESASAAQAALEPLLRDLRSDVLPSRVAAADALGRLGAAGTPAIPAMLEAMNSPQAWVAVAMMDGIKAMGPSAHPAVLDLFERGSSEQRYRAGLVLWTIGAEAQSAAPRIRKLLDDSEPQIREMAGLILAKMDEERGADPGAAPNPRRTPMPRLTPTLPAAGPAAGSATDWTGFRGPNRDGLSVETGLLRSWPEGGPKLLWRLDGLGRGYSSVSIAGGRLYTMGDRDDAAGEPGQFVLAFDLETRAERWAARIGRPHPDGGPRGTPTIDGGRVFALGTDGDVVCLEAASGAERWRRNLTNDFGGRMMSMWKYCESPLVDGQRVICTPGGPEVALVALDKETGAVLWKSAVPSLGSRGKDGAGYASVMAAEIEGVRQYIQVLGRGIVGVAADTGQFLWGYNRIANDTANISNPVIRGNLVFVANSYNAGSALLRIRRDGDRFAAEEVYFLESRRFDNHHGGVVLVGDQVYGGVGLNRGDPVCLEFATGESRWRAKAPSSGSASVVAADGHLVFRYDRGLVVLVAADPREFRVLGRFTPLTSDGPAWAYPVIHGGRLYLRHSDLLACYDLRPN